MGVIRTSTEVITSETDSASRQKIFVDREPQRELFNEKLSSIRGTSNSDNFIYYYGAGGVGKTALLRELSKEQSSLKKIVYDFTSGTDMFMVLNALRGILIKECQAEFPLYEKACIYHYQKTGDIANNGVTIENVLRESSIIKLAQKLEGITWKFGDAHTVGRAASSLFKRISSVISPDDFQYILTELGETSTFLRASKIVLDLFIKYNAKTEDAGNPDPTYRKLADELERRNFAQQIDAVKELMPRLFAQDLSTWLAQNDTNLVILFDTYEKLTGIEGGVPRHEKLIYYNRDVSADWWVEELIKHTKKVLWVIAGRGKDGLNVATNGLCTLNALDEASADKFLRESNIDNAQLRKDIFKLTGGYPIYLDICVDTYQEILKDKEATNISIDDFSEDHTREKVVGRLLKYMGEDSQLLAYYLCILGTWTDDFVSSVLTSLGINPLQYNRLKELSFISEQARDFEGKSVFVFDRTIQEILLAHIKNTPLLSPFLRRTRDAVNKFFGDAENLKNFSDLHFKIWYEIILRTTDDANDLMKQLKENLLPMQPRVNNSTMKTAIAEFAKRVYEKILNDSAGLAAENFGMALFYAMGTAKGTDNYNTFEEKFKLAVAEMTPDERKSACDSYGEILKNLLDVYRSHAEVIDLINETMTFIDGGGDFLGESLNAFTADLWLYKLAALSHLGRIKQFREEIPKCLPFIVESGSFKQCMIFLNRIVVFYSHDIFDIDESFKHGKKGIGLFKARRNSSSDADLKIYENQYFRLCGSLASTCYLTLNKSHNKLKLARKYSDIAIKGFASQPNEQVRSYQTRAQIEAEAGNFDDACGMLNKALNITIENLKAEQIKKFGGWQWYHFAKFCERLLSTINAKYFDIAKRAVEFSRAEFLSYKNELGDTPDHPNYITFSKMATCFDILGDAELAIQLHETALRGVDAEIKSNDDKSVAANANAVAYMLVMMANELRTFDKNGNATESVALRQKIKSTLDEYLNEVDIDSMKVPFAGWFDTINDAAQMSRAILL